MSYTRILIPKRIICCWKPQRRISNTSKFIDFYILKKNIIRARHVRKVSGQNNKIAKIEDKISFLL